MFSVKIARGMEVSNEPDVSDLTSIERFFSVPLFLKSPAQEVSENTMKLFKQEWKNLFSVVKSNASFLTDFENPKFVETIAQKLSNIGMKNIGADLTLELLYALLSGKEGNSPSLFESSDSTLKEMFKNFKNFGNNSLSDNLAYIFKESFFLIIGKDEKVPCYHSTCVQILATASELPHFGEMKSIPIESGLGIICALLSSGSITAFSDLSSLLPIYAKPALVTEFKIL